MVISFHSLEDRIVKRFMRDQARGVQLPRHVPVVDSDAGKTLNLIGRPSSRVTKRLLATPVLARR